MLRNGFVGHDHGAGTGLQRRDARAEVRNEPAADRDVIGAVAERDRHRDLTRLERSGHHGAASTGAPAATPSTRASSVTISATITSCDTSRDMTMTSDSA